MESEDAELLRQLYEWVDSLPLSRPKRNIARDFADGVLVAEIVAHFLPRLVDIHNYSGAQGKQGKLYNWVTLNTKVLKRLGFTVARPDCERIANAEPGAIEQVLLQLKACLERTQPGGAPAEVHAVAPAAAAPRSRAGGDDGTLGHTPPVREPRLAGGASLASELAARDAVIAQLQAANAILEQKVSKLEQLLRLRDAKVAALLARLGVDPTDTR